MNESVSESSILKLSAKIDEMVLGLKWMFVLLILLASIPTVYMSLTIGWFAQVFANALPGMPLPLLTAPLFME